jgi:hypothetical protein
MQYFCEEEIGYAFIEVLNFLNESLIFSGGHLTFVNEKGLAGSIIRTPELALRRKGTSRT